MPQTIFIGFDNGGKPAPFTGHDKSQRADTVKANIGDEIQFDSEAGTTLEVNFFEGTSPFRGGTTVSNGPHSVSNKGTFHYKCTLFTADGTPHGWPKEKNDGG